MRYFLFCLIIVLCCPAVNARMYQWNDPDTGTTQLSGKPPAWYRSGSNGPRVFVFESGKIIDDTGVSVTESERNRLRQQALLQAEEDKSVARDKLLEAKQLEAAFGLEKTEEKTVIETDELANTPEKPAAAETKPTEQDTINQMRSLIEEWEAQRTETAREAIKPGSDP